MINGTQTTNITPIPLIDIVIALGTLATAIILGITLYLQIQDRKPKFAYERLKENNTWMIRILHPDKRINKISISLDGNLIPLTDASGEHFECMIEVGGGQNFLAGQNIQGDSKVVITYDKNKIKSKFKDIPLHKYNLPE